MNIGNKRERNKGKALNSAIKKASVNVNSKLRWRQMKGIECMTDMKRSGLVKKTLMNIKS